MQSTAVAIARNILLETLVINARVELTTVRTLLAGISRAAQDSALVQLQRDGLVVLYRNDYTARLTVQDYTAALMIGDAPRHLVYRTA